MATTRKPLEVRSGSKITVRLNYLTKVVPCALKFKIDGWEHTIIWIREVHDHLSTICTREAIRAKGTCISKLCNEQSIEMPAIRSPSHMRKYLL